jgi:hypothetical protein
MVKYEWGNRTNFENLRELRKAEVQLLRMTLPCTLADQARVRAAYFKRGFAL